jgi:hypothetical protein
MVSEIVPNVINRFVASSSGRTLRTGISTVWAQLPRRVLTANVDDLNAQFPRWRDEVAHRRLHSEQRNQTVAQVLAQAQPLKSANDHAAHAAWSRSPWFEMALAIRPSW